MRTVILTDIHANLPALEAVIADAGKYDRIVFLGDIANFGPHPAQCVDFMRELDAICIIGNHDSQIVSETQKHWWDRWARERLSEEQIDWISEFMDSCVIDERILAVHGSYSVEYDILPNTPDKMIMDAFSDKIAEGIEEIWFGHYHYHIDRTVNEVRYRCFRPVGHHRDKDTRASYYIYENGNIIHRKVEYDIEKTIEDMKYVDCFPNNEIKEQFLELMRNAFQKDLLRGDIAALGDTVYEE